VTNDDGVGAPGIDALVQALRAQNNTKAVVVAPATNQTGVGGRTTDGTLAGSAAETASGYRATAVQGYPADSVRYVLNTMKVKPDVVLSGVNSGQNLGPVVDSSGTVGAAREAAKLGVPALAVSQQLGDNPDFPTGAKLAMQWLAQQRAKLAKKPVSAPTTIVSLNVPNCPGGKVRGVLDTVGAPPGTPNSVITTANCSSTGTTYPNDVAAFNDGWATRTNVPLG
jgi:5'-nucleotidase